MRPELQQIQKIIEITRVPEPNKSNLLKLISGLDYQPEHLGSEIGTIIRILQKFRDDSDFYPIDPGTGLKI